MGSLGSKEPMSAVGFGFGDAVILELLNIKELLPKILPDQWAPQVLVFANDSSLREHAILAATTLRQSGISVDLALDEKRPKKVFQSADKRFIGVVVMFAMEEFAKGEVVIRSMAKGTQTSTSISNMVKSVLTFILK